MAAKFKMAGANGSGRGWPKTIYCQNQKRYTVKIKNGILSKSKTIYCQNQKRYTVKIKNDILSKSKTVYCQNQKRYTVKIKNGILFFVRSRFSISYLQD